MVTINTNMQIAVSLGALGPNSICTLTTGQFVKTKFIKFCYKIVNTIQYHSMIFGRKNHSPHY